MKRLAILASGNGTNLQAIIDAVESGRLEAQIALVLSDRSNAYALSRAERHGIMPQLLVRTEKNKAEYFRLLLESVEKANVDLIVLAGFMKILPAFFIEKYENRIINIHPSLLPAFGGRGLYGSKVHRAVMESGARITGCTVHFASHDVDGGPIIEQMCMEVRDIDTEETIAERIHEIEHVALVKALSLVLSGNYEIRGKRVIRKA